MTENLKPQFTCPHIGILFHLKLIEVSQASLWGYQDTGAMEELSPLGTASGEQQE